MSSNVVESFSNYQAFRFHFGELEIKKVGKDEYLAHRPGKYAWTDYIQRGTKEYINGWLYGAVQTACGQIHKESTDEEEAGDREGFCPVCGSEVEHHDNIPMDNGGVYPWTCHHCGATGEEGYNSTFDGKHYNVRDAAGKKIPGRGDD